MIVFGLSICRDNRPVGVPWGHGHLTWLFDAVLEGIGLSTLEPFLGVGTLSLVEQPHTPKKYFRGALLPVPHEVGSRVLGA